MSTKLKNAPLYYVLADVRFGAVESMEKFIPEFQESLRNNNFPDFKEETVKNVNIRDIGDGQPIINTDDRKRWIFNNIDITAGFILFHDRLIFHTTSYDTFKTFSEDLRTGLECLNSVIKISFIKRTGIRYVDLILPVENEKIESYLKESLLGFNINDGIRQQSIVETLSNIQNGTLISRSAIFENGLNFPPDLIPLVIKPNQKFERAEYKTNAILDADHYIERRFKYDLDEIVSQLDSSHKITGDLFRSSITEYALTKWK